LFVGLRKVVMLMKFWKKDFKYVEEIDTYYGNMYIFSVSGESANYLKKKYTLHYPNIRVNLFDDNSMSVVSITDNKLQRDITDIDDKEDLKELLLIIKTALPFSYCRQDNMNDTEGSD